MKVLRHVSTLMALAGVFAITVGCQLTGVDGSTLGYKYTSRVGGWPDGLTGVIDSTGVSWPYAEMKVKGCATEVRQLFETGGTTTPGSPEWTIDRVLVAKIKAIPGTREYSKAMDDNKDGYVSAWDPTISGLAFGGLAPCSGTPFADSIRYKRPWPGGGAFSLALTDNLYLTTGRAKNYNEENSGATSRRLDNGRLAEIIATSRPVAQVRRGAAVKADVDRVTPDLYAYVTRIVLNGEVIRPRGFKVGISAVGDSAVTTLDVRQGAFIATVAEIADVLAGVLDRGEELDWSMTLNHSVTITDADFADAEVAMDPDLFLQRLYSLAGN